MHNCVGSYAHRVARGECFIYRVLQPERCTLAIAPVEDGRFHIQQMGRARNEMPGRDTVHAVNRWLEQHDSPLPRPDVEYVTSLNRALRMLSAARRDAGPEVAGDDIPF